ncbi:protein LZIC-like [Chrysoperla carnea]|uniref:protein LZIC-like n=1 Tax=Chrysoperla carnea TaxID=189513 RepID=UPI001D07E1DF|nr:protein LZIC-like [Chrysoperla carnea]
MTSSGKLETEKLKENLENQLDRLVQQLNDLESCKDELDSSEYEEVKQSTIEQLKEFQESLPRIAKGDVSLVSSVAAIQMATQAAISKAFKTPEVLKLFGKREPQQLRERLSTIDENIKLNKTTKEFTINEKIQILNTLRQMGEKLSPAELKLLEEYSTALEYGKNLEFEQLPDDNQ